MRARCGLAIGAWLLVAGCDKQSQGTSPGESAVQSARRLAGLPKRGGMQFAGDPTTPPPVAETLAGARLIPVADGLGSAWQEPFAGDETFWIGPVIDRLDDGDSGRKALAVRRAGFRHHVPAAGEVAEVDDDTLLDAGYADTQRDLVLIGPERQCVAGRGTARVIATVVGGHVLDLRWPLLGCGHGPWAPIGLVAERMPVQLRWRASTCPEPETIADAWSIARPGGPEAGWTELGALVIGDEAYAVIGHDGERGVMLIAPEKPGGPWNARSFDAPELIPIRHGCAPPPAAVVEPEEAPDDDSEE
ncbi:MAG: hypothetical protein H7138_24650 [Myxococcales bacterium]|nr:hypothetical protein [Myxococcales bacterium]